VLTALLLGSSAGPGEHSASLAPADVLLPSGRSRGRRAVQLQAVPRRLCSFEPLSVLAGGGEPGGEPCAEQGHGRHAAGSGRPRALPRWHVCPGPASVQTDGCRGRWALGQAFSVSHRSPVFG